MRSVMYRDIYEIPELRILGQTLESEDRVLEIGGGVGFVSTYVARKCGDANITVVEANPDLIPLIEENHRLNGVGPRIINAAATPDDRATETFHVAENFWSSSTTATGTRKINVPAINTNSLLAECDPTYLIVDIEGAESEIIPTLNLRNVRKLLIELHPQFSSMTAANDVILQLYRKGFVIDLNLSIRYQLFMVPSDDHAIMRQSIDNWPIPESRAGAAPVA